MPPEPQSRRVKRELGGQRALTRTGSLYNNSGEHPHRLVLIGSRIEIMNGGGSEAVNPFGGGVVKAKVVSEVKEQSREVKRSDWSDSRRSFMTFRSRDGVPRRVSARLRLIDRVGPPRNSWLLLAFLRGLKPRPEA